MKAHNTYRQSVTMPARMAQRAKSLAKHQRFGPNRGPEGWMGSGLKSKERQDQRFFRTPRKP